ncbi:synaptotagmin-like protein 5 isoform X3 [Bolinopsis microptera]|uniref:synaptotagmin-like protein 5 isoform X3 n=1 Tax=Bolinopsis microptera TaxID=2820187 RepID=UPI00307915C7
MSSLFWFSLFGEEESGVTGDEKVTQPVNPPVIPALRDRSLSAQFFSFFSDENQVVNADACNEVGAISNSPVAKTLSEMAQSLSEMADETIRTFSPAPAVVPPVDPIVVQPAKISYRRKTVFAPTGHLTQVLGPSGNPSSGPSLLLQASQNPVNSIPEEPEPASTLEVPDEFYHNFPSYKSVKKEKEVPLLTSFSRNRASFKDRESAVSQIATRTKTELEESAQEQFTVSNLTGLPSAGGQKVSQLSSISEQESPNLDPETPEISSVKEESLPSVENQPGAIYKYDSEDYMTEQAANKNMYTESDDDDVITADLDFEIFKPLPALTNSAENLYFVDSNSSLNGDSEPLNLIDQLLELGFLTEEEKAKLQKVLAADENLQKNQYNHFIKKHKDLYNERKQCLASEDPSVCPLCFIKFGWFTNSGDVCPVPACQLKVCNSCRITVHDSWICLLCHKEKDLKAQAGYWFQQPAKNKKRVKTGTDILKKSLDTTQYGTRKQTSPSLLDLVKNEDINPPDSIEADGPLSSHNTQEPTPHTSDQTGRNLKAPHIRDIKGQSLSADSGFINDDQTKEDSGILELVSEDDDTDSTQFHRYLMARSVAPDELAPQADTPPSTPHVEKRAKPPDTPNRNHEPRNDSHSSHSHHQEHEPSMSAGASSSNISCESISPSPTMIKANTKDRTIFGELSIGLVFNDQVSTLDVHINEARNLTGVDGNPPNCYVKTYLLPDRSKTAKRKTKTKKRATNPVFNEIFQYKAPSMEDLCSMTLWLTVWDTRQLGHNMFLGEVRIQLDSIQITTLTPTWWQLKHLEDSHFRGSILLGLMYCPSPDDKKKKKTCLKLKVVEARDLPLMDNNRTNPYAALYLIPKTESKDHKYKLQMKKNTVNPKWNAEVNFNCLDSAEIDDNGIEIQMLHLGKVEKQKQCVLIGVVRLCQHKININSALDGRGIEVLHWKEALSKPGVWVEKWHNLRSWE